MSLMRIDPFREFDRLSQQMLQGTLARPLALPIEAWQDGSEFVVEFDVPGVDHSAIDLDIERNVLTVRAERRSRADEGAEMIAEERPLGTFSRQIILSDNLDTDAVSATYDAGVLTVRIPVAEQAKPRRIEVTRPTSGADSRAVSGSKDTAAINA